MGVPGLTGNAVSMSLVNSILASPGITLSDSQASTIRNYVSSCVTYLQAVVNQSSPLPAQPTDTLAMPVAITDVTAGNILSLDVELTFTRQALLTSPEVAALADGLSVSGTILPQGDVGQSSAYTTFATSFETAFQTSGWYMKVGDGLKAAADQNGGTAAQLWAVRFGNLKDQGIYFEIGSAPSYYTPKPVATTLASKTVTINSYPDGAPVTMSFTGVDQNLWFQTCLDAVDTFLAPQYSSSAFILDELLGTQDPLKDGYLGKVLEAKESLAASIASAVRPILSDERGRQRNAVGRRAMPLPATAQSDRLRLCIGRGRDLWPEQRLGRAAIAASRTAESLWTAARRRGFERRFCSGERKFHIYGYADSARPPGRWIQHR